MKTDENTEIGELFAELTSKGYSKLEVTRASIDSDKICISGRSVDDSRQVCASTIVEALGYFVDVVRLKRGEPTREQELAKMLADDKAHADAPPVELGEDASCSCGSKSPLIIERKYLQTVSWINGRVNPPLFSRRTEPGEIGKCPDCGRYYTFS